MSGLYRSDDPAAAKLECALSNDRAFWQRGWYFGGELTVDPKQSGTSFTSPQNDYK